MTQQRRSRGPVIECSWKRLAAFWLFIALLACGCSTVSLTVEHSAEPNKAESENVVEAKVIRVIDGDTMEVLVGDETETVRLLLVDTPETKHPNEAEQPYGQEASSFARKTLEGKHVKLELGKEERDKYGRLLAYVWIGEQMFNELLLEKGLARVAYIYPPNTKYVDKLRETEKKAQEAHIGIWSLNSQTDENENGNPTRIYTTCKEAKAAGAAPLYAGQPGYSRTLDRDGDGVACE